MARSQSTFVLVALALSACAPERTPNLGIAPARLSCNEATSHATSIGQATTKRYAETALSHEIRDLKGDFVRSGFRGVRVTKRDTVCNPYALAGPGRGIYHCAAAARVCGR